MACGHVLPLEFTTGAGKPWGASSNAQFTAACNHGTSAGSFGLRSNFRGAGLAASSPQQSDSADRHHQRFCVWGRRAETDPTNDDECWIADFRARTKLGQHAENSMAATVGTSLAPDTTCWRDFRARLCSSELAMCPGQESKVLNSDTALSASKDWAHRISTPEVGCVLVATNKLRSHAFLKEAVVLLLGYADNQYYGVILNKSMPFPAYTLQGVNQSVLLGLAGCPKYVGGPLTSASKSHVLSRKGDWRGFSTVVPGLSVGGDAAVPGLMSRIADGKMCVDDFKLYIGQMEWEPSIFFVEVLAFQWWDMVACSSTLLDTAVTGDLWHRLRSLYLADQSTLASSDGTR